MQIIRNERRIKISRNVGRIVPWVGIGILAVGWFASLRGPEWLLAIFVSLPIGVGLSMVGGFFAERYAGPLAHHEALAKALKGLDSQHILVNYLLPANHVLVSPGGCTVLLVKTHAGHVSYSEGRWKLRERAKFFRQLSGQEGIGRPDAEAERQGDLLRVWLGERLPGAAVPVQSAIVFVHPRVQVDADESPVPAFYGKKVRSWLRGPGRLRPLPDEEYRQLLEAVQGIRGDDTASSSEDEG
ncbi:MAG: NERD domain-containing protein [Chloroflexi bacterium]|nr:NERD domain-containing protein [Chloroflexota bacterium]